MAPVDVILEDLALHPWCPHGPTLLFSRESEGTRRNFFACSACRSRKLCPFFMYEDERCTKIEQKWQQRCQTFTKLVNHRKSFLTFHQIQTLSPKHRAYCHTCSSLELPKFWPKHEQHNLQRGITDCQLQHPTEIITAMENTQKEAQFLFSKPTVETVVQFFEKLAYNNVICIGTPRIHEFVVNKRPQMTSLLLDMDQRYHNFYGPLQFCWYNMFNHHFFFEEAAHVFKDFLRSKRLVMIMDPPFGGRVEPLVHTINLINLMYKKIHKTTSDLPIFWIFPYFMEPQIVNRLPNFTMLDYKVNYDNHDVFNDKSNTSQQGSLVRIFTNVDQRLLVLSEPDYKYCKICKRWVYQQNRHCKMCKACTSKDGRTYKHCEKCQRCVKPTWEHCNRCNSCAQVDHKCEKVSFDKKCFSCNDVGHKKRDCPQLDSGTPPKKRRKSKTK